MFKIVTIIAICSPTTVLRDDSKFPALPTFLPFLLSLSSSSKEMHGWVRGCEGTLPSGQSRLQQLCFSFMKCTHPTLLEGAQCKSCQGNANPNAAFGIACFCQHLPQFPEPAGRCETRRAAVFPAQLPPASRSAGGS